MKTKIFYILAACIFISSLSGCSGRYHMESWRVEEWREDIEYLAGELPEKHVNLFYKISPEEFQAKIGDLLENLDTMSEDEVRMELQRIVASIGDAHTGTMVSAEKMLPLDLYWFIDGLYIINTLPEARDILYSKIISINDHPVDSVIKEISPIISHENDAMIKDQIKYYITISKVLKGLHIIGNESRVKLTLEDREGNTQNTYVKFTDGDTVFDSVIGKGKDGGNVPLYLKKSDENYWYEYLSDEKTFYFKYNSCTQMENKSFKEFHTELMNELDNDVEKLVIDIRNNGGGDSSILDEFIKEIANSRFNEDGRLYVIVGRKTFSSAILNAVELREKTKAIFIGEPTGGKPVHFGEVSYFRLPNSLLAVKYSTKYFNFQGNEDDESFIPDKEIELSIDDYINDLDPVLDYILEN